MFKFIQILYKKKKKYVLMAIQDIFYSDTEKGNKCLCLPMNSKLPGHFYYLTSQIGLDILEQ